MNLKITPEDLSLEEDKECEEIKYFASDEALSLYSKIFNVDLRGDLDGKLEVVLSKGSLHIYPEGSLVCIYPNEEKKAYSYSVNNKDIYESMLKKLGEIM